MSKEKDPQLLSPPSPPATEPPSPSSPRHALLDDTIENKPKHQEDNDLLDEGDEAEDDYVDPQGLAIVASTTLTSSGAVDLDDEDDDIPPKILKGRRRRRRRRLSMVWSDLPLPDTLKDTVTRIALPVAAFLYPYLQPALSRVLGKRTQRYLMNIVNFAVILVMLLVLALGAYTVFYWIYMPKDVREAPVYFQYGQPDEPRSPTAFINFSHYETPFEPLVIPDQRYAIYLEMSVPNSNDNLELGNFMVTLDLRSKENKTLAYASRPGSVQYQTPLLRVLSTIWNVIPLLTGVTTETQSLRILLVDDHAEYTSLPATTAYLSLSTPNLRTYTTRLLFLTHHQGLRFFMYHYWVTTGTLF
ncbi:Berardinelli-Seip congenital lipodystrophy 2 (seipin), partial [Quaeritorhiza haematococci]